MSGTEIAFAVLALAGLAGGVRLVTARNVVHAALYLVVTLASVAGVYLLLAAEFVAWVQILIYVGAIVILFLFGLMLTKAPIGRDTLDNQSRGLAAAIALGVFAGLAALIVGAYGLGAEPAGDVSVGTATAVGEVIFTEFVLPFEAVSFLLLAALIGAIVLARKEERP